MAHFTITFFDLDSEEMVDGVRPLEKITVWNAARHVVARPITDLDVSVDSSENSVTGSHACSAQNGWVDTSRCQVEDPWTVEGEGLTEAMKRVSLAFDFEATDHLIVRYELTPHGSSTGRNFLFAGDSGLLEICAWPPAPPATARSGLRVPTSRAAAAAIDTAAIARVSTATYAATPQPASTSTISPAPATLTAGAALAAAIAAIAPGAAYGTSITAFSPLAAAPATVAASPTGAARGTSSSAVGASVLSQPGRGDGAAQLRGGRPD